MKSNIVILIYFQSAILAKLLRMLRIPTRALCVETGSDDSSLLTHGSNLLTPVSPKSQVAWEVKKSAITNISVSEKSKGLAIFFRMRADGKRSPLSIRPRCDGDTPDISPSSPSVKPIDRRRSFMILCKSFFISLLVNILPRFPVPFIFPRISFMETIGKMDQHLLVGRL